MTTSWEKNDRERDQASDAITLRIRSRLSTRSDSSRNMSGLIAAAWGRMKSLDDILPRTTVYFISPRIRYKRIRAEFMICSPAPTCTGETVLSAP